MERLKRTP
jgi:hypothetical protein